MSVAVSIVLCNGITSSDAMELSEVADEAFEDTARLELALHAADDAATTAVLVSMFCTFASTSVTTHSTFAATLTSELVSTTTADEDLKNAELSGGGGADV